MLAVHSASSASFTLRAAKRAAPKARRALSVCAVTKKSPAPPPSRFAKPEGAKPTTALVCGECGYVYTAAAAMPANYKCPVCKSPKSAFSEKDTAGVNALIPIIAAILLAAGAAGFALTKL